MREALTLRRLFVVALAPLLAAGCEQTFEPFQQSEVGAFSIFGFLDLNADTQWIRVMPIREGLFLEPGPIDAVVTMRHLESGRTITLRDSLLVTRDARLGREVYAHNFWTTERPRPRERYRVTAKRSDGDSTTALVVMPEESEIVFRTDVPLLGTIQVRGANAVFVDVFYLERYVCDGVVIRVHRQTQRKSSIPGAFGVRGDLPPSECYSYLRPEIRVVTGPSDWPYDPELTDLEVALPERVETNVVDGIGFVGGVAKRIIPFPICQVLTQRPDRSVTCEFTYNSNSASISGRLVRQPCGAPHALLPISLVQRFAGGGAVRLTWTTGQSGEYRFEGIEPGASLTLELPGNASLQLPSLGQGQRYALGNLSVPPGGYVGSCL